MSNAREQEESRPSAAGVPFGRYAIRTRLGTGGMGEVFLADQIGPLGPMRSVALKRMLPQLASDRNVVQMFLTEMGTAAKLNHPNIATTYDFGEVDGVYFLAMEYVEGLPLNLMLKALGALPIGIALSITSAVARALTYAHTTNPQNPVVHQDVTSHNIMVSGHGAVKLLDFGIARTETAVHGALPRGKIAYAPPEQLKGATPDRRFDLWSLGVVLYEMVTGTRPFPGEDPGAALAAAQGRQYRAPGEVRAEADVVTAIVAKALEPDPNDRWQTAAELEAACSEIAAQYPAGAAELAAIVQQLAVPDDAELSNITATGIAAVDPRAAVVLEEPIDTRQTLRHDAATPPEEETSESPDELEETMVVPPKRSPLPLVVLGVAALGIGLTVLWNVQGEAVDSEALPTNSIAEKTPEKTPPPVPPPTEEAAPMAKKADPVGEKRTPKRKRRRRKRPKPVKPPAKAETSPGGPRLAKADPPADAPKAGFGILKVRTRPWARIELDGKPETNGVIKEKALTVGKHRLRLSPGDASFEARTLEIQILAGTTTLVIAGAKANEVQIRQRKWKDGAR